MHVIIQAGGRGSRLRHHTWNKPKCLVSVHGKPVIYHLMDTLPASGVTIIGDYLFEVLEGYVAYNKPAAPTTLVRATTKGTCAGLGEALAAVPADEPVVIVWSDLFLSQPFVAPAHADKPMIGLTDDFVCRWSLQPEGLAEVSSPTAGVAGLFYLPRRDLLPAPPAEGEFVRWFAAAVPEFGSFTVPGLEEVGDFGTIEDLNARDGFTRFFNRVEMGEAEVVKTAVDPEYAPLITREIAWYKAVHDLGFRRTPELLADDPFRMGRIRGQHAYQMTDLTPRERRAVVADAIEALSGLHALGAAPANEDDVREVYLAKTLSRVESVRRVIPGMDLPSFTINGLKCRNPFADKNAGMLEALCRELTPPAFAPIHGDPTFSNTLVDRNLRSWFIDPRGYFARPGVYGDPRYDFAKVFYSAVGNYDAFNRRKFKLHVDNDCVEILMEASPFADSGREVFEDFFGKDLKTIERLHGLIWLSLAGYVRDDIDSIIGAYFYGLYWLESAERAAA